MYNPIHTHNLRKLVIEELRRTPNALVQYHWGADKVRHGDKMLQIVWTDYGFDFLYLSDLDFNNGQEIELQSKDNHETIVTQVMTLLSL